MWTKTLLRSIWRLRMPLSVHTKGSGVVGLRAQSTAGLEVSSLSPSIQQYIQDKVRLCQPTSVHVCDGSEAENRALLAKLEMDGRIQKLKKYDNCYYAQTSPEDVARVEKQTFVCTENRDDTVPTPMEGVESKLGNWKHPDEMDKELDKKFTGCMQGRTMYVIPYSMGPVGSPLSKIGIQLTDSEYVVASMRIMTRMGQRVLQVLKDGEFIRCLHSVGSPLAPGDKDVLWPCNPKKIAVVQFPERNEIKSFGSGYGGNSLLGKKCFALRIASTLARKEGWLAEHMLIVGLTPPNGRKRYIAAAFPSACGKTNLAMLTPPEHLPGWKVECVGDDIAWMKFDGEGRLRAINPENGFFGVAPGTNDKSNPNAMKTVFKNSVFTNTGVTSDGGVFWEGMDKDRLKREGISVTTWKGVKDWQNLTKDEQKKTPASHPNARFCTPISQYPHLDENWESSEGVPIDAILFGGRRPNTIPLVFEAFNWRHGVFVGAGMKSEPTAAASDKVKDAMAHDPFAMRPFFGYNFMHYLHHWLSLENRPGVKLPKIFHVNWFRKDESGAFVWPGFGDNLRVLDWVLRRCDGEGAAIETPLGYVPGEEGLNMQGMREEDVKRELLFHLSKKELQDDLRETETYFDTQFPGQLPAPVLEELEAARQRIRDM